MIDSWSGEYLSKEETERENLHRKLGMHGYKPDTPPMTMEERIQAARKKQLDNGLTSCYTKEETNKA